MYDEPIAEYEQDHDQQQESYKKAFMGKYKKLFDVARTFRNLKKFIMPKSSLRRDGSSFFDGENQASTPKLNQKQCTFRASLNIESTEESVHIINKSNIFITLVNKAASEPDSKQRLISVECEPVYLRLNYWSVERLYSIINTSFPSEKADKSASKRISDLLTLKRNMHQRPLAYLENPLITAVNNTIRVKLRLKSISVQFYEHASTLIEPQVVEASMMDIRYLQKRPHEASTVQKHKYEVYIEKEIAVSHLSITIHSILNEKVKSILSTSIYCLINDNALQDSPLLVDKFIKVFIPNLEVTFPSQTYHISKLMSIFTKNQAEEVDADEQNEKYVTNVSKIFSIYSLVQELSPMLIDIGKEHLEKDESEKGSKICRHCIFKYRKSSSIMQIMIGDNKRFDDIIQSFEEAKNDHSLVKSKRSGIVFKFPVNIDSSDHPVTIEIPFLMIENEKGLFKNTVAVFVDNIQSLRKDKLLLSVKPYWVLNDQNSLFDPDYYKQMWRKHLDYFKFFSSQDSNRNEDNNNHPSSILREWTEEVRKSPETKDQQPNIHLLFFNKSYTNKLMMGYLDGVKKEDVHSLFKEMIVLKIKSIDLHSTDINALSSAINVLCV